MHNERSVCIIDYEYGSRNYAMFDVANFNCEHCGGLDDGAPNYALMPGPESTRAVLREYVKERNRVLSAKRARRNEAGRGGDEPSDEEVANLHSQVEHFELASNLYWGAWGLLQAATEVSDGTFDRDGAAERVEGKRDSDTWDNLRYARNRLARYRVCKERVLGCDE